MNDLHAWLLQQHHGLRTFQIFQQKLATLSEDEPEQRALCRLLSYLVGRYIEAFDEEPLPVAAADRAYQHLLDLVASRRGPPPRRPQSCCSLRPVIVRNLNRRDAEGNFLVQCHA